MKVKRNSKGIQIWLGDFPNENEIRKLNEYGDFRLLYTRLDENRGFNTLVHCTQEKICKAAILCMECPIREWFYV